MTDTRPPRLTRRVLVLLVAGMSLLVWILWSGLWGTLLWGTFAQ